jgi:outer membrane murein-binding lipoprotein Lpp
VKRLVLIAALALGGCAATPQAPPNAAAQTLASRAYALSGQIASLVAAGKLAPDTGVQLNSEIQQAEADIRAGQITAAQALVDSVKKELPQ